MAATTYDELKTYAEEHFPEYFAKLPPASIYECHARADDPSRCSLLVGEAPGAHLNLVNENYTSVYATLLRGELHFSSSRDGAYFSSRIYTSIRFHEPFSWIRMATDTDDEHYGERFLRMSVFLRYCFIANGFPGDLQVFEKDRYWCCSNEDVLSLLEKACADVVKGVNAKKAMLGIKEPEGTIVIEEADIDKLENRQVDVLQDRIERLNADFEAFRTSYKSGGQNETQEIQDLLRKVSDLGTKDDGLRLKLTDIFAQSESLETALKESRNEVATWKQKYEKLRDVVRVATDEQEYGDW
ncbi:hypothetical protein P153DRAFT_396794 [Dothidotthia symphoricarpi CBS 119687]|uniref:Uncharacterized protein n=1 Tax=Dothidotthia symphoricarpi CBS 119687 TaxID=1392245 RepID=A0A6A6AF16_9PLEO|nr:uncharacterized protein P153DRAFT_396794 [Dothidotthia symphoricarpi CBS 119687]KAF2129534.1 hypothetical protein P153DRAFT_396794 [Dothidotthia symphoricarpi CBS 119687]